MIEGSRRWFLDAEFLLDADFFTLLSKSIDFLLGALWQGEAMVQHVHWLCQLRQKHAVEVAAES